MFGHLRDDLRTSTEKFLERMRSFLFDIVDAEPLLVVVVMRQIRILVSFLLLENLAGSLSIRNLCMLTRSFIQSIMLLALHLSTILVY